MSKKVISLLLAVMLTAAMIVVAAISVSADTDDEGSYVPSEGTETYHIYYRNPVDWENYRVPGQMNIEDFLDMGGGDNGDKKDMP